ncbi:MAG TPA: bacteriohopanetetrol glucosamine biosynthesis glycosyltransferase HpnI [Bryobacteraceae bacterium]|nr:bacteriohopanetetrol glucosamine biosynthesis glycosyltransferase HpnI [Bryobacteraceae bacterium]
MLAGTAIAACLLAGTIVYCLVLLIAARDYLSQRSAAPGVLAPISVLKPLAGADEGLEANLRSFFTQDFTDFELLFAVRDEDDPAIPIVEALRREFPERSVRLIVTGEPPYPNAKVFSLDRMLAEASYDLLVMSDSDIRVAPGFLRAVSREFSDPRIAIATCPYRATAGESLWSRLEAEGMNTEFLAGMLVARLLEGVKFAVGPTIVARKSALAGIGGLAALKDYLAEDFVMGKFAAEAGFGVILSRNIIRHHIGSQSFRENSAHRLRWARSTRRSRPLGYLGQIFTHTLPIAMLIFPFRPAWWPALAGAALCRGLAAWATSAWILGTRPRWALLIFQDILSFGFWLAGLAGKTIHWRGRRYYLYSDGRFELR